MNTTNNLLAMWTAPWAAADLLWKTAETLMAASSVVAARNRTIASALISPLRADTVELRLMMSEKVDAFGRSGTQMTKDASHIGVAVAANAGDLRKLASGALFKPSDFVRIAERNIAAMADVVAAPGRVLEPIHSAVTANAKRLR